MEKETYFVKVGKEILSDKRNSRRFLDFLFNDCKADKFSLSGYLAIEYNGKKMDYWKSENKELWDNLKRFLLEEKIDSTLYGFDQKAGPVFKYRHYVLNGKTLNFLKEEALTRWELVNFLPDYVCFYNNKKQIAAITGHERMIELHLEKTLLNKFKKMENKLLSFPVIAGTEFGDPMNEFHRIFKNKQTILCRTQLIERKSDKAKYEMLYEFPNEKYHAFLEFKKGKGKSVAERAIEISKNGLQIKKATGLTKKGLIKTISHLGV